jgi:hypothetical protein
MARLWYIIPTCPPNIDDAKKVAGMVDIMLFGSSTPPIRRTIYTQKTDKPGGLNAPHTTNRILSLNSMWIRLYTLEDLPPCLQEYMQSIVQKVVGSNIELDPDPCTQIEQCCTKVTFKSDFNPKKEVYPTTSMLLTHEYKPMVYSITSYIYFKNKNVLSDPTTPTANVYKSLMKQNENSPSEDQIPIGQIKWSNRVTTMMESDWKSIWDLASKLKKEKLFPLHHGLYNIVTGRFIIPGVDGKYKPCSYCLSKEWSATHTTFECTRVHKTWQALWDSEQVNTRVKPKPICLKDILTVNGFKVKAKKSYVFRLSKLQVKILILMSELIKWTELHKNDQTLKLAIVDEKEFIEDMLRKIELQISYFKKIGIG